MLTNLKSRFIAINPVDVLEQAREEDLTFKRLKILGDKNIITITLKK
jgi:hypothetical protein